MKIASNSLKGTPNIYYKIPQKNYKFNYYDYIEYNN